MARNEKSNYSLGIVTRRSLNTLINVVKDGIQLNTSLLKRPEIIVCCALTFLINS
ncbi:MAG: hypothetical protein ACFFC7_02375 [Candidatus Hermodarchaeota archaeon]